MWSWQLSEQWSHGRWSRLGQKSGCERRGSELAEVISTTHKEGPPGSGTGRLGKWGLLLNWFFKWRVDEALSGWLCRKVGSVPRRVSLCSTTLQHCNSLKPILKLWTAGIFLFYPKKKNKYWRPGSPGLFRWVLSTHAHLWGPGQGWSILS